MKTSEFKYVIHASNLKIKASFQKVSCWAWLWLFNNRTIPNQHNAKVITY